MTHIVTYCWWSSWDLGCLRRNERSVRGKAPLPLASCYVSSCGFYTANLTSYNYYGRCHRRVWDSYYWIWGLVPRVPIYKRTFAVLSIPITESLDSSGGTSVNPLGSAFPCFQGVLGWRGQLLSRSLTEIRYRGVYLDWTLICIYHTCIYETASIIP